MAVVRQQVTCEITRVLARCRVVETKGANHHLTSFTIRVRLLTEDDPLRPMVTCRATIDEEPGFVHAYGLHPAEAVGHAIIYLSRVASLGEGVRLEITV